MPRGRPPTPIGSYGRITTAEVAPKKWEARCWYRDPDGVSRRVRATGASRTGAENALKAKLSERKHNAGAGLTGSSKLSQSGDLWLAQQRALVAAGDRSPRTYETYESAWRRHVAPGLGELRLREATTARCEAWLVALRQRVGPSMCSTARAVLSGVLGYAARMDAITSNPVRDLSPIPGAKSRKRKPRALTATERAEWLAWLDTHVAHDPKSPRRPELDHDPAAVIASRALGDITRLALATGARIGELMAISWDEIDFGQGIVAIRWHIIRPRGEGLTRMPGAKSDAGERVLRLPRWALDMLLRRRVDSGGAYPVFPDVLGGWRDPNLVMRWLRWSRDEAGFPWLTSHVYRQTVITFLDDRGLRDREVADQAGHSRTEQTREYMARKVASDRAAQALEEML
jgi:integrase